jgi:SAM-dependent methyltransferase
MTTESPTVRATAEQVRVNDAVWRSHRFFREYANRNLRPVEIVVLLRYRDALGGRVLELGCGAGRLTGYLAELSGDVLGIDISPAMLDYCRERYPDARFAEGDLRHLEPHGAGSLDAIVAANNVIDVLDDEHRADALDGFHRVLAPGGLLVFSSHNRAYVPRIRRPANVVARHLRDIARNIVRLPVRVRNRRRLAPLERDEPGYAIRNDEAHDYALVHYYIGRDAQEAQLAAHGFGLVEALALDGTRVARGESAEVSSELHYVARRSEG